jgi:catechol 2,3-dioxygenase-like lactoylglutathione lyase family enzyme
MFAQMDHVAVSVKDMEKAIAFYQDIIGLEKVFDREFDAPMAKLIGVEGTKVRIVHMRLGDATVELFYYYHPKGRDPLPNPQQSDFGLIHIGFKVTNFHETYRKLKERGVQFLGEPVEFRPDVFIAYFRGAEHEVCEMREIAEPS